MPDVDNEIDDFLERGSREVEARMRIAGEAAVAYNREMGSYKDRTGNLRRSNYYKVEDGELEIGNSADYAAYVESKGYMVCSGGALLAELMLNGN